MGFIRESYLRELTFILNFGVSTILVCFPNRLSSIFKETFCITLLKTEGVASEAKPF